MRYIYVVTDKSEGQLGLHDSWQNITEAAIQISNSGHQIFEIRLLPPTTKLADYKDRFDFCGNRQLTEENYFKYYTDNY